MTHLDAEQLRDVDYIAWRLQGHALDGVPDDPLDRYLWIAHAYNDWLTCLRTTDSSPGSPSPWSS